MPRLPLNLPLTIEKLDLHTNIYSAPDENMEDLRRLTNLKELSLSGGRWTMAFLPSLQRLKIDRMYRCENVQALKLYAPGVVDAPRVYYNRGGRW